MAKTQTRQWDPAEHLESEEDMAAYLNVAFEEGDLSLIMATLGDISRARRMAVVAQETGLGRESLYKSLSVDGNPEFATVLKVVRALGLRLEAAVERGPDGGFEEALGMRGQEYQFVLEILKRNIRDDYCESSPRWQALPQRAVENATAESLRAFRKIHEELSRVVDSRHIRTRYTGERTSTGGYGISYYRDPIISKSANRKNREIQAICLPTRPQWQGILEVYFSGHREMPVESMNAQILRQHRAGLPVFHIRNNPTSRFVQQTIDAFRRSSLFVPP